MTTLLIYTLLLYIRLNCDISVKHWLSTMWTIYPCNTLVLPLHLFQMPHTRLYPSHCYTISQDVHW